MFHIGRYQRIYPFQLHHAVHNMSKKPLGLFWQFRPSTSNYNDTLYYNLIQDLTIRHKTSDRAERQFTQVLLSDGGQKKPGGKNPMGKKSAGNLGRNHGSNSTYPILRGYKFQTRLPALTKRTLCLEINFLKKYIEDQTRCRPRMTISRATSLLYSASTP